MTDTQTQPGATQPEYSDKLDKRVLMVAGVVVLGAIMSILDITVVTVALQHLPGASSTPPPRRSPGR